MAGKKKKAKKKAKQRKSDQNRSQILGANAGRVGTALVSAVVGEIAQAAINRVAQSTEDGGKVDEIRGSVKDAAMTVSGAVKEAKPSVQAAIDAVKTATDDVQPVVARVMNALHDRADGTKETMGDVVENSTETVAQVAGKASNKVKEALKAAKPGKKKKKA
jgi:hypothetical protein